MRRCGSSAARASRTIPRKRFVQGFAALGGGLALGNPLSALAARTAKGQTRPRASGYGELRPTPELDSGKEFLTLPPGFSYGLVQRSGDPLSDGTRVPASSTAWPPSTGPAIA